jgi:hypothetical protein
VQEDDNPPTTLAEDSDDSDDTLAFVDAETWDSDDDVDDSNIDKNRLI